MIYLGGKGDKGFVLTETLEQLYQAIRDLQRLVSALETRLDRWENDRLKSFDYFRKEYDPNFQAESRQGEPRT